VLDFFNNLFFFKDTNKPCLLKLQIRDTKSIGYNQGKEKERLHGKEKKRLHACLPMPNKKGCTSKNQLLQTLRIFSK
jgi:hypothetical protein